VIKSLGLFFLLNSFVGIHETVVYKPLDLALFEEFQELESPEKEQWVANKIQEWKLNYAVQSKLLSERKKITHLLYFIARASLWCMGL